MIEILETAIEIIGLEVRYLLFRNCTEWFCKATMDNFFFKQSYDDQRKSRFLHLLKASQI